MTHSRPSQNIKNNARLSSWLFLLVVYLTLAVILTWPVIAYLPTHLPGDGGDDPAIAWNFWWVKYALLQAGQNPFQSNFIFYPLGINLAFYTLTVLNALVALPLTLNLGVVAASNLHLWFTFAVSGYGAFVLARYVLAFHRPSEARPGEGQFVSPALAGLFYAFASSKLFYVALGQFNIASNHWIPWVVLYVLRTHHNPRRLKNALLAGLFFTLQAWSELTYASFLLVFIALFWVFNYKQFFSLSHLRAVLLLGLTFGLGLSPILAQMLPDLQVEGDFLVEGSGFAQAFSADLFGFFIPTYHHPWLGNLVGQSGIQAFDKGQHIYLGWVLLGLCGVALFGSYRYPPVRFWLVAALFFALLCLGPIITINGHPTHLPGPFRLLQDLPFFRGNRYPSRYSVMLLLSLSVIAAFALAQLARLLKQHSRNIRLAAFHPFFLLVTFLFLFEHLTLPLPLSDMRIPAAYQTIAATPGDFAVLDIPFAWRNGFRITGALTTQFMFGQFYQTLHQKRLLQGNTSRNPPLKIQYFTRAPVLNSLLALETGYTVPPAQQALDRTIAPEVLAFFNIKYIVVRPFHYDKFDGQKNITVTEQAAIPYVETVLPVEKIYDDTKIKIYQVLPSPRAAPEVTLLADTGNPLAPLFFAEGWGLLTPGQPVAAQRKKAKLLLPLTGQIQQVSLRLRAPELVETSGQTVQLELNSWKSPVQDVSAAWQTLTFDLPNGVAQPGLNQVWLNFAGVAAISPPGSEAWLPELTSLSAGDEVGDFGQIFINGHNVSTNQRGYNVVIVEPDGVPQTASFDTHLDPAASTALADFIAAAPLQAFIALAAADEASAQLSEEAVKAVQALGVQHDLRGCFRCSHAFIRAPSGETLEASAPWQPVGVTTGLGLTEPALAAEIDWVRIEDIEP